jgi:phosphatidylglycerophosphatase A
VPGTGKRRPGGKVKAAAPRASLGAWVLGSWFGSGFSPIASGTAGTAATLPLAAAAGLWLPALGAWNPWCLLISIALFYPAVWSATQIELQVGKHDPGVVVVDETLGTLLTMAFLPAAAFHSIWSYVIAFFLFRLLDIWKPGLINRSQALPRGWGIVVDDVLAGLLGGALLGAAWWLHG